MALLSIHSAVVSGHVGNSAAAFPVQCLGIDVWQVPTVLLSNHPGHGRFTGQPMSADLIRTLVDGIADIGTLAACDAVLTGYFSSPEQVEAARQAIERVQAVATTTLCACDPVIGDEGKGLYVSEPVAEAVRDRLVQKADVVTPNSFELGWLTGRPTTTQDEVCQAARNLREAGPGTVLVTSFTNPEDDGRIGMLLDDGDGVHVIETPRLPISVNGAGDMAAALFVAHRIKGQGGKRVLETVANTVYAVIERTWEAQRSELVLVDCRDIFENPPARFAARTLDLVH